MPVKDRYHDHVKNALTKDGWTITADPLKLKWKKKPVFIDLAAEQENLLAAEKGARKIAVEIKSFVGLSQMNDLYSALGQFILYREALLQSEPERELYLAIRQPVFESLFTGIEGESLRERQQLKLIVFDARNQEILQWIE